MRDHLEESLRLSFLSSTCEEGELEFVGPPTLLLTSFSRALERVAPLLYVPTEVELNWT